MGLQYMRMTTTTCRVDWEGAKVLEEEPRYWRRRTLEAIHMQRRKQTSNLDCGLALNDIWTSFLDY